MNPKQQHHDRRKHRSLDRPKPDAEECLLQTLEAIRALDNARMVAPQSAHARDRLKGVDSELWNVVEALQDKLYDDEANGDDPNPRPVADGGTVTACPECDGTNIHPRANGLGARREGDSDAQWRCYECKARFDEPVERAPKATGPGPGNSGLAKTLADADKDAIPDGGAIGSAVEEIDTPLVPGTAARDLRLFHVEILRAVALIERSGEECSGQAIKDRLDQWFGEEINHGRLYPNLDELVHGRVLEKGQINRRTNRYVLTDEGRAVLTERTLELADAADLEVRDDG